LNPADYCNALIGGTPQFVTDSRAYTLRLKNVPLCDSPYLRQIFTDFRNSFTGTLCGQVAVMRLLNPTTSLLCLYTTMWNLNCQKSLKSW